MDDAPQRRDRFDALCHSYPRLARGGGPERILRGALHQRRWIDMEQRNADILGRDRCARRGVEPGRLGHDSRRHLLLGEHVRELRTVSDSRRWVDLDGARQSKAFYRQLGDRPVDGTAVCEPDARLAGIEPKRRRGRGAWGTLANGRWRKNVALREYTAQYIFRQRCRPRSRVGDEQSARHRGHHYLFERGRWHELAGA